MCCLLYINTNKIIYYTVYYHILHHTLTLLYSKYNNIKSKCQQQIFLNTFSQITHIMFRTNNTRQEVHVRLHLQEQHSRR